MITRRSFLQALMGLPAIAALPDVGKLIEALPERDPEPLVLAPELEVAAPRARGLRLFLNDILTMPQSITMVREADFLYAAEFMREPKYETGLHNEHLLVEMMHDPCIRPFMNLDRLDLRAEFGVGPVLLADARIRSVVTYTAGAGLPICDSMELYLSNARMIEA